LSWTRTSDETQTYDVIAQEYYDAQLHPTCSNFNQLSRVYLNRHLDVFLRRRPVLEIGAGHSAVAELLQAAGAPLRGVLITDSSSGMLSHSSKWAAQGAEFSVTNAEHMDATSESFDVLVSSLGDPYNTIQFWAEAARVLRRNGIAIFTTPSFQWAVRYRAVHGHGLLDKAEFRLQDGSQVLVPSKILPLRGQIEMIESAGLVVVDFQDLGADELDGSERRSPKTEVFGNEPSSLIWGFIARKDADPVSSTVRQAQRKSPI
jgi:ubiquinone/menaquinone biosynthesis C-methylase UbiE